jgi:hypothetical protein
MCAEEPLVSWEADADLLHSGRSEKRQLNAVPPCALFSGRGRLLLVSSIRLIDLSCWSGGKALARNPKCGGNMGPATEPQVSTKGIPEFSQ